MSSGWERIANAMNVRATLVCGWLVRNRTDADLTAIAIGADGAGAGAETEVAVGVAMVCGVQIVDGSFGVSARACAMV